MMDFSSSTNCVISSDEYRVRSTWFTNVLDTFWYKCVCVECNALVPKIRIKIKIQRKVKIEWELKYEKDKNKNVLNDYW